MSDLVTAHQELVDQVQYNCDISDARHAGNYTLCIYLLKMREYYRWINALDFNAQLDNEGMAQWLRKREEVWDEVVDEDFRQLTLENSQFDPFDHRSVNRQLVPAKLLYHAGIGQNAAQHFFIARLADLDNIDGIPVYIAGQEYARDLTAPPALSNQGEIIVRQESLKRMCWERYQEWNWNRLQNPMGTALSYYPFEDSIEEALSEMVARETKTMIHHELGEIAVEQRVDGRWGEMMLGLLGSRAEIEARAIRDFLADSLHTLPFLLQRDDPASLHFFFANLSHMRKAMAPRLLDAYQQWADDGKTALLIDLTQQSANHWQEVIDRALAIAQRNQQNPEAEISSLIQASVF
jgi:hypothetical protein